MHATSKSGDMKPIAVGGKGMPLFNWCKPPSAQPLAITAVVLFCPPNSATRLPAAHEDWCNLWRRGRGGGCAPLAAHRSPP